MGDSPTQKIIVIGSVECYGPVVLLHRSPVTALLQQDVALQSVEAGLLWQEPDGFLQIVIGTFQIIGSKLTRE